MTKSKTLNLAKDLSFPIEIAGQAICTFGLRGSGKTNTAGALAEELLEHGHPIAVIDPTDAWWGLRAGSDGSQTGGYQVFIFGGSHADVPLSETDGKVIAEFLVREQVPVVLSLRHLRKAAQRRFVTEFCEELYHLKGKDENRTPLTVFIDEAPLFVPQKVMGEVARTVGAVEDLIARGRNAGFGVVLISQRSATLNADVRTQADTIICHRVTAALDRKALSDWFEANATTEDLKAILKSLATLKNGEAWVWSPALDIMSRVQMRMRRTFDSSATPKAGTTVRPPKKLAQVDLEKLKGQLAATIEKAKADDPKELRRRIAELEREVKAKVPAPAKAPEKRVEVKVPFIPPKHLARLEKLGKTIEGISARLIAVGESLAAPTAEMKKATEDILRIAAANVLKAAPSPQAVAQLRADFKRLEVKREPPLPRPPRDPHCAPGAIRDGAASDGSLQKHERRLMTAIAQYPHGRTRKQVLTIAGLADSGRISSAFAKFRAEGWMVDEGDLMKATEPGLAALGPFDGLPTGDALIEYWERKLENPTSRIFAVLVEANGSALSRGEVLARVGLADSGRISSSFAKLRRLELMRDDRAGMVLNQDMFS